MNSGVERRAERLGDARALVLLDDEGRRQDEDVAEARHRRRVAADDDAGLRAEPFFPERFLLNKWCVVFMRRANLLGDRRFLDLVGILLLTLPRNCRRH